MPAGGETHDPNPVRVDAILGGVRPKPANGGFAVLDLSWESRRGNQAIADRGRGIAAPREHFDGRGEILTGPAAPTSAMNANDCRERTVVTHSWQCQIELQIRRSAF